MEAETTLMNDVTEPLVTVLRRRGFKSLIIDVKKEFCLICVLHEGIWNESVCMLRESLRGGMRTSLSVFGMATFSLTNLYSIVTLESAPLSDGNFTSLGFFQ